MDNKFVVLRDTLHEKGINLNNTAADENVSQIKRQVKVLKKLVCSTWTLLLYKKFPNIMI